MDEKGNLYLISECQIINVQRMMKLESYHLTTVMVITDSVMNHQSMLKLAG
jgi:hypothetical protein